jgi:hypothetical protein
MDSGAADAEALGSFGDGELLSLHALPLYHNQPPFLWAETIPFG